MRKKLFGRNRERLIIADYAFTQKIETKNTKKVDYII